MDSAAGGRIAAYLTRGAAVAARRGQATAGLTTGERERLKELEREVRELKRANEILRKASTFFAQAELDRGPTRESAQRVRSATTSCACRSDAPGRTAMTASTARTRSGGISLERTSRWPGAPWSA